MTDIATLGNNLAAFEGRIIEARTQQQIEIDALERTRKQTLDNIEDSRTALIQRVNETADIDAGKANEMFDLLVANRRRYVTELESLQLGPAEPLQIAAE
ncbi:hypothetical protein [Aestuariivirga sp.]|uniref:hypothetical protein n=1 Tax=Aestuariivirga sp. TaxID=2650926 RepID=UPI0039E6753D